MPSPHSTFPPHPGDPFPRHRSDVVLPHIRDAFPEHVFPRRSDSFASSSAGSSSDGMDHATSQPGRQAVAFDLRIDTTFGGASSARASPHSPSRRTRRCTPPVPSPTRSASPASRSPSAAPPLATPLSVSEDGLSSRDESCSTDSGPAAAARFMVFHPDLALASSSDTSHREAVQALTPEDLAGNTLMPPSRKRFTCPAPGCTVRFAFSSNLYRHARRAHAMSTAAARTAATTEAHASPSPERARLAQLRAFSPPYLTAPLPTAIRATRSLSPPTIPPRTRPRSPSVHVRARARRRPFSPSLRAESVHGVARLPAFRHLLMQPYILYPSSKIPASPLVDGCHYPDHPHVAPARLVV